MSTFEVRFWTDSRGRCPVEKWLASLDKIHQKRMFALLRMLGEIGRDLHLPHCRAWRTWNEQEERTHKCHAYFGRSRS